MFIDKAEIKVTAGKGGNGAVSFHREKYVAAGGPDGGDGGKGGDVIIVADTNVSSLLPFKYKTKYTAENGKDGSGKRSYGKKGQDLVIKVPMGTLVREKNSGRIVADIHDKNPVTIAKGGNGGWGNMHFATPTRQIPRFSKPGQEGESLELVLELKLIADVGLVGFPNVGKSSLITAVSNARPQIANYHFTTLTPVLGVVNIDTEKSFVMADIPGLIEGAKDGAGLGHEFLRHVERCRLILHVVDVSGMEGRDPYEDFLLINKELSAFSPELAKLPMMVAANKCDIADEAQADSFCKKIEELGYAVFKISAAGRTGTRELVNAVAAKLDTLEPVKIYEAEAPAERRQKSSREFEIFFEDGIYFVEAAWLDDIVKSCDTDDYESLQYLQRVIRQTGIVDSLEQMGINEGDTVAMGGIAFDYIR